MASSSATKEDEVWELALSKKQRQKLKRKVTDYVDIYGPKAKTEVEIRENFISIKDAQALIFALLADGVYPKWIYVKNRPLMNGVIFVLAPGLSRNLYEHIVESDKQFLNFLGPAIIAKATSPRMKPGQLMDVIFIDRRHPNNMQKRRKQRQEKWFNLYPPSYYKLKREELEAMDFPGLKEPLPEGFVKTGKGSKKVRMFALDCEMCITEKGLELTRATLLDENEHSVMDTLVKPDTEIKDYLYSFSGITPEMMKGCTTKLKDVQKRFLELVSENDLLVGHSLDNDLKALKIVHENVLDTCVLYPHPKGLPYRPALKVLTQKFLKRQIQQGTHDSKEDAKAALDLTKLKIKHGPDWGTANYWQDCGYTISEVLSKHKCSCVMVDRGTILNKYAKGNCSAIPAESDEEALAKFQSQLKEGKFKFNYMQIHGLTKLQERRSISLENRMKSRIGLLTSKLKQLVETDSLIDPAVSQHDTNFTESFNPVQEEIILDEQNDEEMVDTQPAKIDYQLLTNNMCMQGNSSSQNEELEAAKQQLYLSVQQKLEQNTVVSKNQDDLETAKQQLYHQLEQLQNQDQIVMEEEHQNGHEQRMVDDVRLDIVNKKRKTDKGEAIRIFEEPNNENKVDSAQNVNENGQSQQQFDDKMDIEEEVQKEEQEDNDENEESQRNVNKWSQDNFLKLQIQEAWSLHHKLLKIQQAAKNGTMLFVMTGHGNTGEVRRLWDMRNRCQQLTPLLQQSQQKLQELQFSNNEFENLINNAPTWTDELDTQLSKAINREIQGMCFCKIVD
eukprot:TRINITY_DN16387_c1_g1_i1.p1 TRINITY_DN16387_c1_g1~~TRINITY_DN16387_c1_g1_i1.p1  ORF type:complete len:786 (-),score=81.34 TRINITY_DN16387_c1_g1_i1:482-2839(-)